jgi:hypothetical protein
MSKLLVLGNTPALLTDVHNVFATVRAGLRAQDVNGADRQNVDSARRLFAPAVRSAMQNLPGTRATIAYLYFCACFCSAFFSRTADVKTRLSMAFQTLHFFRYWRAWLKASPSYSLAANFVSLQFHSDIVIAVHSLVLSVLIWQRCFPTLTFCPWLFGSDQVEHFFSEMRGFVKNNSNMTLFQFIAIARRWTHQSEMLARNSVKLEPLLSAASYNNHVYATGMLPPLNTHSPLSESDIEQRFFIRFVAFSQ